MAITATSSRASLSASSGYAISGLPHSLTAAFDPPIRRPRPPARITGGKILFQGRDLLALPRSELRRFRWRHVSLVFQSAMNALNPVLSVGDQFVDMIRAHEQVSKAAANAS